MEYLVIIEKGEKSFGAYVPSLPPTSKVAWPPPILIG